MKLSRQHHGTTDVGWIWPKLFGNNSTVESYCQTIHDQLSKLVYNGSLSVFSLFRNPTTQEKNNLIEETFRGNTVTQSIEDETKAQDFSP